MPTSKAPTSSPSSERVTAVSYEEWQKLPGATPVVPSIARHPERYEFGIDRTGFPVARMTDDGVEALKASLKTPQ